MNKLFKIAFLALLAVGITSCSSKKDDVVDPNPELEINLFNKSRDGKLAELNGTAIAGEAYFYISFDRREGTFTSYDNMESGLANKRTGLYEIAKDEDEISVISGIYDFSYGEKWNNEYAIISLKSDEMTWKVYGGDEVQRFVKVDEIPDDVVNGTRSIIE